MSHRSTVIAIALLAAAALSGCAASQLDAALSNLKNDTADACVTINTSVAGYAGTATACRSNSPSGQVTADKSGNVSIARGAQAAAPVSAATAAPAPK